MMYMIPPKKKRSAKLISRITTWILRITILVTVLFFIVVMLAATLSGNGVTQKAALEQIFSGVFGREARIQKLNAYEMFPTLKADFENMVVLDEAGEYPLIILEQGYYVHDSIQRFLGGEPVIEARFKNFLTAPGFFGPYSFHMVEGGIDTRATVQDGPHTMTATGNYGGYDLRLAFPLAGRVHGTRMQYRFVGEEPIIAKLDGLTISAVLTIRGRAMVFDPVMITTDDGASLTATLIVPGRQALDDPVVKHPVLKLVDQKSGLTMDGELRNFGQMIEFVGQATGDAVDMAELRRTTGAMSGIITHIVRLMEVSKQKDIKGRPIPDGAIDVTFGLNIKSLKACETFENLTGTFRYQDKKIALNDLKWKMNGADYAGQTIDQNLTLKVEHDDKKASAALAKCLH